MRRVAPWLLLALLVLGTVAAAALGVAQKPSSPTPTSISTPSQWVAGVLASTERAGTAHFSYTHTTSSPNPDLRGSLSGHGVVNFTTGDVRVTEIDHDITFTSTNGQPLHPVPSTTTEDAIVIGGTVYQENPIQGFAYTSKYHVLPFHELPRSQRGLSLALNASVALDALRGPNTVASVTDLGPAEVHGVATSQYEVTYAPLRVCAAHQAPQVLTQRPSLVWVDDAGRLVRVRSTNYYDARLPQGAQLPAGSALPQGAMTLIATLTFSELGAPVHVAAPPASEVAPEGSSTSFGTATAKIDTCRG